MNEDEGRTGGRRKGGLKRILEGLLVCFQLAQGLRRLRAVAPLEVVFLVKEPFLTTRKRLQDLEVCY